MTKEEAKLVLDNARPQTKEIDRQFYDDEDLNNALDMAIKALEQQSDDCISRQAVIEYIEACDAELGHDIENESVRKDILNMPSVIPTQRWIPVSKELPKEGQRVFVTQIVRERTVVYCTTFPFDKIKEKYIIAWQPLPKPYEEKRGSKND